MCPCRFNDEFVFAFPVKASLMKHVESYLSKVCRIRLSRIMNCVKRPMRLENLSTVMVCDMISSSEALDDLDRMKLVNLKDKVRKAIEQDAIVDEKITHKTIIVRLCLTIHGYWRKR